MQVCFKLELLARLEWEEVEQRNEAGFRIRSLKGEPRNAVLHLYKRYASCISGC